MKKYKEDIFFGISCIILIIIGFAMIFVACDVDDDNPCNDREITKLYLVEEYKIHEAGVEIWAISDDGDEYGFFIEHEDVYSYEEHNEITSRVIGVYECRDRRLNYVYYLYFSKDEFKEYIKERYDIE